MLLAHPRAYLDDTSSALPANERKPFPMVDYEQQDKMRYGDIIARSQFVLCPRGYASSTWRLYETMKAGRVPVIISDQWVPPIGPAWETCSIRVREKDIAKIPHLLEVYESRAEVMGQCARRVWEEWFSIQTVFHRIVEWCLVLKAGRQSSIFGNAVPYVQLLRPFFFRHVVLAETKKRLWSNRIGMVNDEIR
jgi:hypothetical protein